MSSSSPTTLVQIDLHCTPVSDKTTWQHVVLTDGDGRTGVGEYTLNGPAHAPGAPPELEPVAREMSAKLDGAPVAESSLSLLGELRTDSIVHASVYSACSQALVSLCAQAASKPIAAYLDAGPVKDSIRLYANINRRTEVRTPEGCAQSAMDAVAAGFDAVKIAPFDGLKPQDSAGPPGRPFIASGLDRLRAMRAAVGPAVELYVDCHWRFDSEAITAILPELETLGIVWLECPIAETSDNIPALKALRKNANERGMRLCGLETTIGLERYAPFFTAGAYDLVMPDIKHAGGYRSIMAIADLARRHGTAVSLHNPSGPVAYAASLQLSAVLPGDERLEVQYDESPLFWQITDPPPPNQGRRAAVPAEPGLGISLLG